MRAGFAHYKGDGEWEFINDQMPNMLARFGVALQEAQRDQLAEWIRNNYQNHPTIDGLIVAMKGCKP